MSLGAPLYRFLSCCLPGALLLCSTLFGAGQAEYVLETQPTVQVSPLASKYGLTVVKSWPSSDGMAYLVSRTVSLTQTELRQLRIESGVKEVEPNIEFKDAETSTATTSKTNLTDLGGALKTLGDSPFYGAMVRNAYVSQRAASQIRTASAQTAYGAGAGIVVAIIDTGVDPNHSALRSRLLPGYDFTRDLPGTASEMADLTQSTVAILDQSTVAILDENRVPVMLNQSTVAILDGGTASQLNTGDLPIAFGHGTMIAGLVHLVAPQAFILPLKAFRADGSSNMADIVRAIRYAADNGAHVISMSFSVNTLTPELKSALDYATKKGVLCVASAGNEGRNTRVYPAGYGPVISVGSTNGSDRRSAFSNYGDGVKTASPGEALITTYPGGHYAGVWGTSFSAALVSGTIASIRNTCPSLKAGDMMDVLGAGPHIGQDMGDARLDVLASLAYCMRMD